MPIYAYRCTACEHAFDRLQKMSDPDPENCPLCAAAAVKRQLTAPSFRLSGSGWYETDFKKDGDRKRNLTEGGEGAKPETPAADKPTDAGKGDVGKGDAGKGKPAESGPASKPDTAKAASKATPSKPAGGS